MFIFLNDKIRDCNLKESVEDRADCVKDLLPRIVIMFGLNIAKQSSLKFGADNPNIDLPVFELLKSLVSEPGENVKLEQVKDDNGKEYIPEIYNQHLKNIRSSYYSVN